ncbi:ER translocation nucleotide exchange factor, putative [Cordyceps militaris CM01]|uniref:ER translocation nucleotide exchange factor, putative n=1 Tax=Cordyceps militaris (strain CM01) TaxID=983644 RepID=G3JL14_CORMM|nr:ER translocation nucleotide exchange factor, putative [Cordyceps militaris CM01]EGX90388.1 ER translocation nucleotide exchange factor, putative [Cordyceps militaris CM01]
MPSQSRLLRLPTLFALLLGVALAVLSTPVLASAENSKPDLICHTSDPQDCYPRLFEATDEFQQIRDGQEIPQGLHVRLNIYTGEKEAKINVPGEGDPSLEGLLKEQAVVVVEPAARDDPIIPPGAPVYETAGQIKTPPHAAKAFVDAMKLLKAERGEHDPSFDASLEGLEELAHDMYYGLQIAEDPDVVKALVCHMIQEPYPRAQDAEDLAVLPRDQQAAAILAASLQNNPTALAAVSKQWPGLLQHYCPEGMAPLASELFRSIGPRPDQDAAAAPLIKARVAAISGLIKDPAIRADFLRHHLMGELARVLAREDKAWAAAQRKVGLLAVDHFLDADMGAVAGEWPRAPKLTDEQCAKESWQAPEGCWDYHVARIAKANKGDKGHWSRDVQARLAAARKKNTAPSKHVEL